MTLIKADNGHICWLAQHGDAIIWRCENCCIQVTSPDKNNAIRDATCHKALNEPDPPDNQKRRPRSPIPWEKPEVEYAEAKANRRANLKCYSRGGSNVWGVNGHPVFTSDLKWHGP